MKKKMLIPAIFTLSLFFAGAGCVNTEQSPENELGVKNTETEVITEVSASENNVSGLELKAEALGEGKVKLSWTKSDDIKTDAERGFVLVRSTEKDPIHDETNYWFRQSAESRETVWKYILPGNQHFRICALQDEKCAVYSNDVELEVK